MKKLLLTAVAAIGMLSAYSQDTSAHKQHHSKDSSMQMKHQDEAKKQYEKEMDALYLKVGLDESKSTQVRTLMSEFKMKAKELKMNTTLDKDARKEQYKALLKDRNARLEAILGAEKWKELEKEIKDYRKSKGWEDEDDMMEKDSK